MPPLDHLGHPPGPAWGGPFAPLLPHNKNHGDRFGLIGLGARLVSTGWVRDSSITSVDVGSNEHRTGEPGSPLGSMKHVSRIELSLVIHRRARPGSASDGPMHFPVAFTMWRLGAGESMPVGLLGGEYHGWKLDN